ncbi:hypothetical protein TrRE_jg11396, partial [Triparma retinervis]
MNAHMRNISFENMDVVIATAPISISPTSVYDKLVTRGRGGYCFEQNTLLLTALTALSFPPPTPLLCRVRWGKSDGQTTPFTHMCLRVEVGGGEYLADVGFAGVNSMDPIDLDPSSPPQPKPEGVFRTRLQSKYRYLEVQDRGDPTVYRALYCWAEETPCEEQDLEQSNWFSCTYPGARFTGQFFAARIAKDRDERHHILNDEYVVREMGGEVTTKV